MAAVGASADTVGHALRTAGAPGSVVVANLNSPEQTVISGPTADVDTAVRALRAAGLGARRIPVACAFHSPLVAAAGSGSPRCSRTSRSGHRSSPSGPTAPPPRTRRTPTPYAPDWPPRSAPRWPSPRRSRRCTRPGRGSSSRRARAPSSPGSSVRSSATARTARSPANHGPTAA
ncbi:acyltransferase domain-containing protein [Streptomyces tricolor]|nr:acyltransferase domain-containing protein [Streptomyces tricolor]